MKSLSYFLAVMIVLSCVTVLAEEPVVIATYDSAAAYKEYKQGAGNWYYREYKNEKSTDMVWDAAKSRWLGEDTATFVKVDVMCPGPSSDSELVFVSPMKGNIHLKGEVVQKYANGQGDGVTAYIAKNKNIVWSQAVKDPAIGEYDLTFSVKQGDEIHFRVSCGAHNAYDMIAWWPVIHYVNGEYVEEAGKFTYFQYDGKDMTELTYNEEKEGYVAADEMAFISDRYVMPTEGYSLIQRYTVEEDGRHRVYGFVNPNDNKGSGDVVTVFKNGEKVWEQLFPEREEGNLDVRMLAAKGDVIDVMISVNEYTGYNYAEWECDIVKYMGTLFCNAATSAGNTYATVSEYRLSSLVGPVQGGNGVEYYSIKFDQKYPMSYYASSARWQSEVPGDGGYISAEAVSPGSAADTVMEQTISQAGLIRIEGNLPVSDKSDGVLSKIYLNGTEIWSSRVGGERSVRWDEKYDTSYFLNSIHVTAEVQVGDKLTFRFNRWRLAATDDVRIDDVRIKYITGSVLSKTTQWKLKKSVVVDTEAKLVYRNGASESADVFVENETTYMAVSDIPKVLGDTDMSGQAIIVNGKEYLPLRDAANHAGRVVVWAAERLVLIHDGIPVFFGFPELSEISAAMKGGGLFD